MGHIESIIGWTTGTIFLIILGGFAIKHLNCEKNYCHWTSTNCLVLVSNVTVHDDHYDLNGQYYYEYRQDNRDKTLHAYLCIINSYNKTYLDEQQKYVYYPNSIHPCIVNTHDQFTIRLNYTDITINTDDATGYSIVTFTGAGLCSIGVIYEIIALMNEKKYREIKGTEGETSPRTPMN